MEPTRALNALTVAMLQRRMQLCSIDRDRTGSSGADPGRRREKAFCVRADLKSRTAGVRGRNRARSLGLLIREVFGRLEGLNIPVIDANQGYALGGGMKLALACDLRVAADTARWGSPRPRSGACPEQAEPSG